MRTYLEEGMERFKVRAIGIKNNDWVQGFPLVSSTTAYVVYLAYAECSIEKEKVYPDTYSSCSGMYDMHNNLIWEHDYVKVYNDNDDIGVFEVVSFHNSLMVSCGLQLGFNMEYIPLYFIKKDFIEVVGNSIKR